MPSSVSTISSKFQSTLSVRRATPSMLPINRWHVISIHALRKESDADRRRGKIDHRISIHALRKESDPGPQHRVRQQCYFNPRSP